MIEDELAEALSALVEAWSEVAREKQLHQSACILATRTACEALSYFSIKAVALPVQVGVHNAVLMQQLDAGLEPDWESGAWGVGIDPDKTPTVPGGWNGHLVAHLPEHDTFIDLTLDQFARPAKNINVQPLIAGFGPELLDGIAGSYEMNGCRIWYHYRPDLTSQWRDCPDGKRNIGPFAGYVIRKLKPIFSSSNSR